VFSLFEREKVKRDYVEKKRNYYHPRYILPINIGISTTLRSRIAIPTNIGTMTIAIRFVKRG